MSELKGSSSEIQEFALIGLLHDTYLLAKCIDTITPKYFDNDNYKIIYKCLSDFYRKNQKLPEVIEMCVELEKATNSDPANTLNLTELKDTYKKLNGQKLSSETNAYDEVREFIKRNLIEDSLNKIVTHMESAGSINLDNVASSLQNSLSIEFSKLPVINLANSDIEHLKEVRASALGTSDSPITVKFFIDKLNECMQYKALIPGTLNMITASPGSGKTTLLINQGIYTALCGLNILHVFLGDMSAYDGLIRYLSCLSNTPSSKIVEMSEKELSSFIKEVNQCGVLSKIDIASYAADQLTSTQLIEEITAIQKRYNKHYHAIIIDYDENISVEADSMYTSGGQIYNKIALFAVLNKSVIFIASQPKPEYWKYEILPMEAASESSKKQKIIDLMITMGKPTRDSTVATLHIAKNRRGVTGKIFRVSINGETAKIKHITEEEYEQTKQVENNNRGRSTN